MPTAEEQCLQILNAATNARAQAAFADAEKLLSFVPASHSSDHRVLTLHAVIAAETGRIGEAIEQFESILKSAPNSIEALTWLASIYRMEGQPQLAIPLCERTLKLQPDQPDALVLLGICYLLRLQIEKAVQTLQRAVEVVPDQLVSSQGRLLGVFNFLSSALRYNGDLNGAADALSRAIHYHASLFDNYIHLGDVLRQQGDIQGASRQFRKALDLGQGSVEKLIAIANEFSGDGNLELACEALQAATKANPRLDVPWAMLGDMQLKLGRFDHARQSYEQAIALEPRNSRGYLGSVTIKKVVPEDKPLLERAESALKRPDLQPIDRINLHFALGKACDDLGAYPEAMRHFDRANRAAFEQLDPKAFDRREVAARTDERIRTFTTDYFARHRDVGSTSPMPILIVGMIRSGTTLLEQMLTLHPKVGAGGELPFLLMRGRDVVTDGPPNEGAAREVQSDYLKVLQRMAPGSERVTDKLPMNYRALGVAHLLFPNAKIIHCRRSPAATCFSIYSTPFDRPLAFGHDKSNIAFFYEQYLRDMEHMRSVLPSNQFFEFDYEELVASPEVVMPRIVEFCGLEWNEACLHPDKSASAIRTPSAWQARQKVYGTAAERWRHYEAWLSEFAALEARQTGRSS